MYAIVEIAGKQYRVEKDDVISVDRLSGEKGEVVLDRVLFFSNDGNVTVGAPYIDGASVKAENLGAVKGDKVRGVKFKKRKNYTRTLGSRRHLTRLKIADISTGK